MGGTNISKQVTELFQETLVDISTSVINSNITYTTNVVDANQIQNMPVTGNIVGGTLTIGQDVNVENRVYQPVSVERKNQIYNDIMSQVMTVLQSTLEQANEKLNLLQQNVAIYEDNIRSTNYVNFATTVANTTQSVVNNTIRVNQELNRPVTYNEIEGDLDIVQNINIENVIENIVNSKEVTDARNEVVAQLDTGITRDTTMQNIGVSLGIFFAILIMIVILPLVIWGIYRAIKSKSGGGGATKSNSNTTTTSKSKFNSYGISRRRRRNK